MQEGEQEKPGWGGVLSSKSTEGGQGEAKEQRSDQPKVSQLLSLPLLIQNIRLYYWCSTREHILCSGDSLHFPENTMERVSQYKVTDLPLDSVQAKLLTSHFVFPEAQQVHMVGESTRRGGSPCQVTRSWFFQDLKSQMDEASKQAWQKRAWERSEESRAVGGKSPRTFALGFQTHTGL